jgi:CPA1 family monovalent cation:H+ antiporter
VPSCPHLDAAPVDAIPRTRLGCQECLQTGQQWNGLRLCLECGHVGCDDTSPAHHARDHFEATGHAVVKPFESAEDWRWCYVDDVHG